MNSLEGKVALVTGGGAGIGLATVYAFARADASVFMADNNVSLPESSADAVLR
jgi:NAD(P)-dependent dehydrogenase (short-subunit alcohol dehydrogenase family)